MTLTLVVLFILLGLALLLLEILIVPGFVVGIIGVVLMIVGIGSGYYYYGGSTGSIILLSTVALTALSVYFSLRSKTWNNFTLQTVVEGRVNEAAAEGDLKVGDKGIAVSRLATMGKIMIGQNTYEAESLEGFITENKDIVIVKIKGNKIFVKLAGGI